MKFPRATILTLPLVALSLYAITGCEDTKSQGSNSSALDLTAPQPAPAPAPIYQPVATAAPETAPTPISATVTPTGNTYTIKPGDTLWKIAATHYGDGKKWQQIVDANPGLTPSKLRIGQTITLP